MFAEQLRNEIAEIIQPAFPPRPGLFQRRPVEFARFCHCLIRNFWDRTERASLSVPDPKIQNSRDAIIKITACAICGSDLHLFDGYQPTMESGDILGHENMGEVIELG